MLNKINANTKTAIKIGSMSIITYLVSYTSRHIMSVVTPDLLQKGIFTKEYIGLLTSVYLAVYALGQLFNGILGDRIISKYMVFAGLMLSGCGMLAFPLIKNDFIGILCFAVLGFGLSMLRGPLMKIIVENTEQNYARKICVLFSVATFAGPLIASAFSIIFKWKWVFIVTAIFAITMAVFSYTFITYLEKKGLLSFRTKKGSIFKNVGQLFKIDRFVYYILVGSITEIVTSSITFWIPTYLNQHLMMTTDMSAIVFSAISVTTVMCPFLCIFLYEHVIKDDVKLLAVLFSLASVFFVSLAFTENSVLNVIILILARTSIYCAATALWSIYIPSLAKSGSVSSANGIYDFAGYAAASVANIFFSRAITTVGWNGLIFVWTGIMVVGMVGTFAVLLRKKHIEAQNY